MSIISIENKTLRLPFERETGALVGLEAVQSGWKILGRSHLDLFFRLLVPLPGRRNNPVLGEKQKPCSVRISPDGSSLTLFWDGVTSEYGGRYNIRLTLEVQATDRQAIFSATVENGSDLTVENLYFSYLGNIQHPPDEQ